MIKFVELIDKNNKKNRNGKNETSEGYLEDWGSQRCAREGEGHAVTPVYATSWADLFHWFVVAIGEELKIGKRGYQQWVNSFNFSIL
jgi:hypothetical protein